jgi:PAS domain S-box-containing protein
MNIDNRDVNAQLRIQSTILEMIALRADLDEILARLCIRLSVRSAPGIPEGTRNCFNGLAMAPNSGSCGTAAYTGKMVIVENTLTDPRWEGLRDLARKIGKLSCWSVPVFYAEEVVGTFAISRSVQGAPGENELALLGTAGNLVGIAITADRADSELRDQRSLLQSVVDSAEDPICAKDLDRRYLLVNRARARAYRMTPEEMLGLTDADLVPGPTAEEIESSDRRVLGTGEGQLFEQTHEDPEQGERALLIRKSPLLDANGQSRGLLEVARDVTALKKAEEALRHAQKLESLGVLAGGIAHDFNNLLTGVLGNAELAFKRIPEGHEPLRKGLRQIVLAANRAAELTRQMLAYSGRAQVSRGVMSLPGVVKEVAVLLASSISKKARLTFDIAADLPNIEGDPAQMRQLVMNIITNASDALEDEPGEIVVEIRVLSRSELPASANFSSDRPEADRYVVFSVRDSGHGMDRVTISRIFDPFYSTKFLGRGLGLAAVHGIVRGHGGAIDVQSENGVGTSFSIFIPASAKSIEKSTGTGPIQWSGDATVLLVEDEELVTKLATDVLRDANLRVIEAKDGQEAVDTYRELSDEIDLVVLDLTTPRLSGREVCDKLRAIRKDVRIILSSGYVQEDATHEFDEHDLAGFVHKPYTPADLLRVVRDSLS